MTRRGAAVLSAAAPGTSRPSVRYSLPETTRRPCRAAQTKIRAQGKSEKKRLEQKTNKGNAGGVDPGPEPFDLPAVTTQIFSRRLRTRDEHRGTGTTNHGGTTGNGAGAGRDPRRRRHAKGTQSSATNNGRTARKRGTGEPLKGGLVSFTAVLFKKTHGTDTGSPCQYFRVQYFRRRRTEPGRKKNPKRRRTGDEQAGSWTGRRVLCASSWLLFAGPEEVTTPEGTKGPCRRSQSKIKGSPPTSAIVF